jgi:nitrile hydratase accessory protein
MIDELLTALSSIPRDEDGPVFREPWEAQAFAMAVALHGKGLFTWVEWADALSKAIKSTDDFGHDYYHHWLSALERLVIAKNAATLRQLHALQQSWDRAARATPHGQPIELANDPSQVYPRD